MAKLTMITETSKFMMSYVIETEKNNCIIVDGGRPLDMPSLKEVIAGRHISAWFLTHAHCDHISGFTDEMEKNGGADFDLEGVYHHLPDYDEWDKLTENDVPDLRYFKEEINETLPAFNAVRPKFAGREHIVQQGEVLHFDELTVRILYTSHDGLYANPMNDSSLVFRIDTPSSRVLFLGDLGPDGGDVLFRESRQELKADYVQMAHHGHMNIGMEVYAEIAPRACLWNAPDWLYDEPEVPKYLSDTARLTRMKRIRMYGEALTRKWMDILGVKEHYVTKDGTQVIEI